MISHLHAKELLSAATGLAKEASGVALVDKDDGVVLARQGLHHRDNIEYLSWHSPTKTMALYLSARACTIEII
jgi:hypothetical protein